MESVPVASKTQLSVNVNKVATLRNSRGKNIPDVVKVSLDLIKMGAQGITVHPRPDERHIKKQDVFDLKEAIDVELNVEGYPSSDFLELVEKTRPAQVTLVPDPPHVLTSNAGWEWQGSEDILKSSLKKIKDLGLRSSLFVDPMSLPEGDLAKFKVAGCDRVELYTEAFSDSFATEKQDEVTKKYAEFAKVAHDLGFGINAGHDLNLKNLAHLKTNIPMLDEVSIGHALVCDALYLGFEKTIQGYLDQLKDPV